MYGVGYSLSFLYGLVTPLLLMGISVARLHDQGRSGGGIVISIIICTLLFFVYYFFILTPLAHAAMSIESYQPRVRWLANHSFFFYILLQNVTVFLLGLRAGEKQGNQYGIAPASVIAPAREAR